MMKPFRHRRLIPNTLVGMAALAFAATFPVAWGEDHDEEETPFDEASIFFELNDTDGDLGIHALIDGEPWKYLEIEDPKERKMLYVNVKGRLRQQGLTELFFESAEPTFDELLPEEFFKRFPEGKYEIKGKTLEGEELESEAKVTHKMPAPPGNVTVNMHMDVVPEDPEEDCDEENLPQVSNPVVIEWDAVTTSHPTIGYPNSDDRIKIVRYQVVAEWEDEEENTFVDTVDVQPVEEEASYVLTFSPEFFRDETEVKFEVLVREKSGNQTAVETCPFEYVEDING